MHESAIRTKDRGVPRRAWFRCRGQGREGARSIFQRCFVVVFACVLQLRRECLVTISLSHSGGCGLCDAGYCLHGDLGKNLSTFLTLTQSSQSDILSPKRVETEVKQILQKHASIRCICASEFELRIKAICTKHRSNLLALRFGMHRTAAICGCSQG